jgi:uncharacterized protein
MVRFVLDVHLGKLARQLRMVGFDSLWRSDFSDEELLRIAVGEGRVLLTRDRALWESTPQELRHYVNAIEPGEQLREVLLAKGLVDTVRSGRGFLSRCLECNSVILPAKRHHVEHLVGAEMLARHQEFFLCPRCERVYWKGSHWERMAGWVKRIVGESEK